jgi:ureidoacrylate peracid hydrolase
MARNDESLVVAARPTPLSMRAESTAVVVVDMQNDFGAEGGMFARAGIPIDGIRAVVPNIARVLEAGRRAGLAIIYLVMQFEADLADAGDTNIPNRIKHAPLGIGDVVDAPDGSTGRVLVRDTWNTKIIEELTPKPGDHVVAKHRYSGFYDTELDAVLGTLGAETLIVTGCTTSVCVDSTVRDAFFRDYRCLVLADCVAEPLAADAARSNHEATLLTIETVFGWVSSSEALIAALSATRASEQQGGAHARA